MRPFASAIVVTAALVATATAQEGPFHLLRLFEPKPGQVVITTSISEAAAGRLTVTDSASKQTGSLSLMRSRSLERRLLGSGPKVQLQYKVISDQLTSIRELGADKETEVTSGVLVGKTVFGFRDATQRWRLFLKGQAANAEQAHDVSELEAYENRRWFLESPVQVGQTWPIDPAFTRHLTERDAGKAKVNATMTFKAVEKIDNEPTAVLTFKVETVGSKSGPEAGLTVGASSVIALTGIVYVSLDTMLDKKLTLTGFQTKMASEGRQSTLVSLPVNVTVIKTVR